MIDDTDQSYVNGVLVGSTNRYNEKRIYQVPANVLKEGKNVIAVRVEDTGGGGGIYGDATDLSLTTKGNTSISLAGAWQYNMESLLANANSIGPNTYPTLLFNAMLNPLVHYGIQGAIWYQGESNAFASPESLKEMPCDIGRLCPRWTHLDTRWLLEFHNEQVD